MKVSHTLRVGSIALGVVFSPLRVACAEAPAAVTTIRPGRDISYNTVTSGALSPEQQRQSFTVPAGFEVELVVAESEGFGKFIALAWDSRMRLWSMTALEYPVDGNEQKSASDALFARGGRDKVVVFDAPYGAPAPGAAAVTAPPRVFADGLVMPLGVLPYKDGAFVQYGADIRFYRDTDADGRADRHEIVLTGFGTQDSHLFPHQFLRQPGGNVFVAQGLFNYSTVRRPGGQSFADGTAEVEFNQCKLARFALDGSRFENLTAGPNNIWGLHTSREGETFIQEANDIGYAVIPYEPGIHVRTGSNDRLRPYQPLMPPPLGEQRMGGTGLSGLALAEDGDDLFRRVGAKGNDDAKIFFLANPIANSIQVVRAVPDGGRYRYEKLPDFLTTVDRWFRPVALHFGPDGALYIVDWYNKIISHNEVPRTHPDRDKTRGRIWRIRHREQPRVIPPDLTQLEDRALLAQIGGPNALVSRLAWLEIIDRQATALAPDLERIATDRVARPDRRLAALWALEGLKPISTTLAQTLAADPDFRLRREAARLAPLHSRSEADFIAIASPLVDDSHPAVRAALGDALRRLPRAGPRTMALAARLGRAPLASGSEFERYEREFERFLARWAMESNSAATRTLLDSAVGQALPVDNRVLALLAVGGRDGAVGVATLLEKLGRPPDEQEVRAFTDFLAEPAVSKALARALADARSRASVLRALLNGKMPAESGSLVPVLLPAVGALLESGKPADVILAAQSAGAFKLSELEASLVAVLTRNSSGGTVTDAGLAALRALRAMGRGPAGVFDQLAREARPPVARTEAIAALAASAAPDAIARLVALLPVLNTSQRGNVLERLASTTAGATALVAGLRSGAVPRSDIGVSTVEKLRTLLPDDASVATWWKEFGGEAQRALRLDGGASDFSATQLTLSGPFTVECWVKLDSDLARFDALLGAPGRFGLDFDAGQLRVETSGEGRDLVVATKKAVAYVWNHYAVTRDAGGVFRIYFNGELDATGAATNRDTFTGLDVGRNRHGERGTAGWLAEFRVWNTARTHREIRENFDRSFSGPGAANRPAELAQVFAGAAWGPLQGNARVVTADDLPILLTAAEAAVQTEKFNRFRGLANTRGNPEAGKELFTALCLTCHQHGGKGGQIAPPLDGLGFIEVDALLRNILTPSAAMESAYRIYRAVTRGGSVHEGFLVEENADTFVLRRPGAEDLRLARAEIRSGGYLRRSLMPEGLLEGMTPGQVSDLFAYIKSLR
jgi:putative membrane-bound dehydrogenase-like protein